MTDEEIIKAFEYCTNTKGSCKPCCYSFIRNGELACNHKKRNKDILEIINRLKEENASLTVENEVLKRDVQNLERTLEEGREAIENLKADKNILLIGLEDAERKIKEYKSGETITLTKTEYERLEKAEMEAVLSSYHLRENVRKETAKEFAESIRKELWNIGIDSDGKPFRYGDLTSKDVWRIAKQYGVEGEE